MSVIPDLSKTVIDSETGEIIHQGNEGPEIDRLRARHNRALLELLRETRRKQTDPTFKPEVKSYFLDEPYEGNE